MSIPRAVVFCIAWASCACGPEPLFDEVAVVAPHGKVGDLSLVARRASGFAIGWLESQSPNRLDSRAAFMLVGPRRQPTTATLRDDNVATKASELCEIDGAIARVLVETGADQPGLVWTLRDAATGELVPDGYRTLPVFASGEITQAHLIGLGAGLLVAWVERTETAREPRDNVLSARLGRSGELADAPAAILGGPERVDELLLRALSDGRVALVTSGSTPSGSRAENVILISETGTLDDVVPAPLPNTGGIDDRAFDAEVIRRGTDEGLLIVATRARRPLLKFLDTSLRSSDLVWAPIDLPDEPAVFLRPRLERAGDEVLLLSDRADGSTRAQVVPQTGPVVRSFEFPLSSSRCTALVTLRGDPLPYACAAPCRTLDCGDEWIYLGHLRLP